MSFELVAATDERKERKTRSVREIKKEGGRPPNQGVTEPVLVTFMYKNQEDFPSTRRNVVRYVNQIDNVGRTPLHYFAGDLMSDEGDEYTSFSLKTVFAFLVITLKGRVDVADNGGKTALAYLVDRSYWCTPCDPRERKNIIDGMKFLVVAGANPHKKDKCGLSPFDRAAVYGDVEMMDIMEKSHIEVNLDAPLPALPDQGKYVYYGSNEPLVQSEWQGIKTKGKKPSELKAERRN